MPIHTTFEHSLFNDFEPTPRHLLLARRLLHSNPNLFQIDASSETTRIRATQHVGILRMANTTLQILPKIHRPGPDQAQCQKEATRNLLAMLAYAHDLPLLHHAAPLHHQSHDWLELLTHLFATHLRTQLHAAPHRNYQSFDDDLPLLRGKLRIADQLRRPDRQHRFACTFDEFSIDNPLNRVFRFVTERLFFQTTSSTNRQLLNQLRTLLDEVPLPTRCTPTDADSTKLITRLNRRYAPTLHLARLFLSHDAPHLTHGPHETLNFLFDMNQLFEQFIAAFLQKHRREILSEISNLKFSHMNSQRPQKTLLHEPDAQREHFVLKPDITFHDGNHFPLIIDTKYKCLDISQPHYDIAPADIYQMLAYAHRYDCRNILLLYPQTADMENPLQKTFAINSSDIHITAATINLTRNLTTHAGRTSLIQELRTLFITSSDPLPV